MPDPKPCNHRPHHVESVLSGWVVPARWSQSEDDRRALQAANGRDLVQERATAAVVLGAVVLMVLFVVRMVCG